jgi:hypothetical protein
MTANDLKLYHSIGGPKSEDTLNARASNLRLW